jgi:hypothetical protein
MWTQIGISVIFLFVLSVLAPGAGAEMLAPAPVGDPAMVKGTIGWADERGVDVVLKNGQRLVIPLTINVRHVLMTPPRSIKAYYTRTLDGDVVNLIVVEDLQPGSGG